MKRIGYIICTILSIMLFISVYANATEEDRPLTDLLTESQNAGGLAPELDPNRLPDDFPSVEGKPILVVFQVDSWNDFTQYNLEELYEKSAFIEYTVIGKTITIVSTRDRQPDEKYQIQSVDDIYRGKGLPAFITDILNSSSRQTFFGIERDVQNVICIRGFGLSFVYYITDSGIFVRAYKLFDATKPCAAEFTFRDFQIKFGLYIDFFRSDWYQCDADGNSTASVGGHFFLTYIKYPELIHERYRFSYRSIADRHPYLIPLVCIGAALGIGRAVYCFIRDNKKKNCEATITELQSDNQVGELP